MQDIFNKMRATTELRTGTALLLAAKINTIVFIYSHLWMPRPDELTLSLMEIWQKRHTDLNTELCAGAFYSGVAPETVQTQK